MNYNDQIIYSNQSSEHHYTLAKAIGLGIVVGPKLVTAGYGVKMLRDRRGWFRQDGMTAVRRDASMLMDRGKQYISDGGRELLRQDAGAAWRHGVQHTQSHIATVKGIIGKPYRWWKGL